MTNIRSRYGFASIALLAFAVCIGGPMPRGARAADEKNSPPSAGDKAPDFELPALDGKKVRLSDVAKKGPVVLVVLRGYPGYQCPICRAQLGKFVARAADFAERKAQVVLIYPGAADGLREHAAEFAGEKPFPNHFHFLLDPDYKFVEKSHLRWDAPMETAYPSTFVIDGELRIRFAKVSRKHGGRSSPEEVLAALDGKDS